MTYLNKLGRLAVTVEPAAEPITRSEAKAWLRIEDATTADDGIIDLLITNARAWVEQYLERKLITQTVTQTLDDWPDQNSAQYDFSGTARISDVTESPVPYLELLAAPVQSVSSVVTYDDSDNASTWDSGNYRLSTPGDRSRIAPVGGNAWPVATRDTDAVIVTYVAGYGASGADVPGPIKMAMYQLIALWYENREAMGDAPDSVRATLIPYKVFTL